MKRTWLRSATFTLALALAAAPVAYAQGGQGQTGPAAGSGHEVSGYAEGKR